jgi:trimethyllysine dioxygenase
VSPTYDSNNLLSLLSVIEGPTSEPHVSIYPWAWLQTNSYDPPVKRNDSSKECVYQLAFYSSFLITKFRPILWGSKIDKAPPSVTYGEAMAKDDRGLFKWLSYVVRLGGMHPFIFHQHL